MSDDTKIKEELVSSLAKIIAQHDNLSNEELSEVLKQVGEKAKIDRIKILKKEMSELFDEQVDNYSRAGCPEGVLDKFRQLKQEVISQSLGPSFEDGNIPFLLVPSICFLGIYGMVDMLKVRLSEVTISEPNFVSVNLDEISKLDEKSRDFCVYAIYDINLGGVVYSDNVLKERQGGNVSYGNHCHLSLNESFALAIQFDILSVHNLNCSNSRNLLLSLKDEALLLRGYSTSEISGKTFSRKTVYPTY